VRLRLCFVGGMVWLCGSEANATDFRCGVSEFIGRAAPGVDMPGDEVVSKLGRCFNAKMCGVARRPTTDVGIDTGNFLAYRFSMPASHG
jgi:hypothetical protein